MHRLLVLALMVSGCVVEPEQLTQTTDLATLAAGAPPDSNIVKLGELRDTRPRHERELMWAMKVIDGATGRCYIDFYVPTEAYGASADERLEIACDPH